MSHLRLLRVEQSPTGDMTRGVVAGALLAALLAPVRPTYPIVSQDGDCGCVQGEFCMRAGNHPIARTPWLRSPSAIERLFAAQPCGIAVRTTDYVHALRAPTSLLAAAVERLDPTPPLLTHRDAAVVFFTPSAHPAAAAARVRRLLPPHANYGYIGGRRDAHIPAPVDPPTLGGPIWLAPPTPGQLPPDFPTVWTAIVDSVLSPS